MKTRSWSDWRTTSFTFFEKRLVKPEHRLGAPELQLRPQPQASEKR